MYLGIEIGGTKLQLGVGPGDGTLAGLWRGGVDLAAGGEGIRRQIVAAVPDLLATAGLDRSQVRGLGIGFGGPVDDATRSVLKSHQVGGWEGFPLADWAEEALGLPTALGNDADCAALAEALFGAGKGLSPVFYMTIGSGIGGGLVVNGEVYRGAGRGAVEVGHLRLFNETFGGEDWNWTTLEDEASGWSIARRIRERAVNDTVLLTLVGGDPEKITTAIIAQAAASGNELALWGIRHATSCLADALCQVIVLLCPRRIVIGGGVSLMGQDLLFKPLCQRVAERVFRPFADCYEIVPAALGEEVVVHGALRLAATRSHLAPGH
ncbi:MAG TPA: ROK family protein [Gemmataceae bacterium]|jgi:glucokinase